MTSVDIEYCVPCGLLDRAIKTQARLLSEFGQDLDGVTLSPGHGGVFIVTVDDETVWVTDVHGTDLDLKLIVGTIDDRFLTKS